MDITNYWNTYEIYQTDESNHFEIAILSLLLFSLCDNTFSQTKTYSFEVIKSGKGAKSIIFISGFASSGEVWDETKTKFEKD
jgi:hypothetical protein